jgi:putative transposase
MEETLTVLKLRLPPALRSFLVTTNAIENLIGSSRRICRNVTRWRAGDMISRWAVVGLLQAEQHFRRVRGYRYLSLLKRALRGNSSKLDATEKAA